MCLVFQLFSAGMFISSTAFLPSSFAMYTFTAACASWWQQRYPLAVFLTALGALLGKLNPTIHLHTTNNYIFIGWPFAALLSVPIAIDMLFFKKYYRDFVQWCIISALVILVPMIIIDSLHYGRLVIAPWNIVKYNIFEGAGPNLYGTEPFSFYFINGFLNFNITWVRFIQFSLL